MKKIKAPALTAEQKEFQKLKRYVTKRFPGARTICRNGVYKIVDGNGYAVVDPELMLPSAKTPRQAWEYAKYASWFSNMIRKSNNAFSDEKIFKTMFKDETKKKKRSFTEDEW